MHPDLRHSSRLRLLRALLLTAAAWPIAALSQKTPLDLVDEVDLVRYQGLWYEIALLPNEFQSQCIGETTAEYALKENGRIRVVNRCRTADGTFDEAVGEARRPDADREAALKVRFAPKWLAWLPFVWGDYQVIALDEEYRWAMVGAPSREFLWILAREPELDESRIESLLARAREQGFDTEAVERTRQQWP